MMTFPTYGKIKAMFAKKCLFLVCQKNSYVHTNYQQLVQNICQLFLANGHMGVFLTGDITFDYG